MFGGGTVAAQRTVFRLPSARTSPVRAMEWTLAASIVESPQTSAALQRVHVTIPQIPRRPS
eukprot:2021936-Prymnesium_polylepis.2